MSAAQKKWRQLIKAQRVREAIAANKATGLSAKLNACEEKRAAADARNMNSAVGMVFTDLHMRHTIRLARAAIELHQDLLLAQKEAHRQRARTEKLKGRLIKEQTESTRKDEEIDLMELLARRRPGP